MTTPPTISDTDRLLNSKISVPQNVVYRSFPSETVMLNLETCKYHGLNPTAGQMLDALERASSLRDAAVALSETFGQPQAVIEQDICELCSTLLERGLIEIDEGASS